MGRRIRVLVPRLILSLTGDGYNSGSEVVVSNAQWEIIAHDAGTVFTDLGFEMTTEEVMNVAAADTQPDDGHAVLTHSARLTLSKI